VMMPEPMRSARRAAISLPSAEDADAQGMRVLRARCSRGDTGVPFAAALQLLGPDEEFDASTESERERAARLWGRLRAHAEQSPLLVAVDDVHLADAPSHRWLVESARHVGRLPLPVLLVVTERSQYDIDPPAPGFTHTLSPALVRTHTLVPLTEESAARRVRSVFPDAPEPWVDSCVRAAAGNPLLLRALLDDLGAGPHPTVPASTAALYPGAYPAAVSWWLDSAGPTTAEVARALAVLDEGWEEKERFTARSAGARRVPQPSNGRFREGPHGPSGPPAPPTPSRTETAEPYGTQRPTDAADPYGARQTPVPSPAGAVGLGGRGISAVGAGESYGDGQTPVPDGRGTSGIGAGESGGVPGPVAGVRGASRRGAAGPYGAPGSVGPDAVVAAAVAGGGGCPHEGSAALLAELAGADAPRVAGWLTAMTGLGVLRSDREGRPRYAHPLLRDAMLIGVPAERRSAAHRQAAEAMLHSGASTEAVARQLLLTGPVGRSWAPAVLQDAVLLALRDDRRKEAAAFLRRALDEPLPDDRRQRLLTELGSLEYADHQAARSIGHLYEALRLPGAPQDRVRTAVALGTALAGRGRTRAAMDVLRAVDGQLTDRPELVRTLQTASALLSDQDQAVRREVHRWLCDTAERSPELVGTAGQALLVRYASLAGLTSAEEAVRRIRALLAEPADPLTEPFLIGTAAAVAQWADELADAERLVERGLAGQRPGLLHPVHDALRNTRADIVAARADHAALLSRPLPPGTVPTNAHAHTVIALVEAGRPGEARRLADGFDLSQAPDNWELNRFLYARGVLRAASGDPTGALHDFLECGRRQSAREVVSPVVTPWRTAAAECRLALGLPREALALAEEELRLARVWNTPRTVARALRVLGTATGGHRGLDLTEEAVRLLRDGPPGTGPDLAAALIAYGRRLASGGDRARARELLREAADLAERLGARRLRTRAADALRATGARRTATPRTGSAALTTSERRIAELAAQGRTNTEITELLHLARRTVETHLTSTYKKLGIRRRSELTATLGQGS
ncbi:LuxR C-terminal-related transcriptional regulator, partial [Streptomyces sp. NPDC004561]